MSIVLHRVPVLPYWYERIVSGRRVDMSQIRTFKTLLVDWSILALRGTVAVLQFPQRYCDTLTTTVTIEHRTLLKKTMVLRDNDSPPPATSIQLTTAIRSKIDDQPHSHLFINKVQPIPACSEVIKTTEDDNLQTDRDSNTTVVDVFSGNSLLFTLYSLLPTILNTR